ncbi:MAG: VWA domain-containing protein [Phycisphaerae bacterium]|jgi:Ca-activated chloride channel family protein
MFEFQYPWFFLLLIPIALAVCVRIFLRRTTRITYSDISHFSDCPVPWRVRLLWLPSFFRVLALVLLVCAIARPRMGTELSNVSTEGVAMQLVVDRSSSMNEPMIYHGMRITRYDAVKMVMRDFILGDGERLAGRKGDMIGLVTFARYPDRLCPLVHSHNILVDFVEQSKTVEIKEEDGTAIGDALALAAAALNQAEEDIAKSASQITGEETEQFKIKSKVIVLLTDGVNNQGEMQPADAARLAADWGIKIYSIGIGSNINKGIFDMLGGNGIDEKLLSDISTLTNGFYARADSPEALKSIYERIDKLEKTEIKAVAYYDYSEKFEPFAFAALAALMIEIFLRSTILRCLP